MDRRRALHPRKAAYRRLMGLLGQLSARELKTMLVLIDNIDKETGLTCVGADVIASMTGIPRRAVEKTVSHFREIRWLDLAEQGGGRGRPNKWRVTFPETSVNPTAVSPVDTPVELSEVSATANPAQTDQSLIVESPVKPTEVWGELNLGQNVQKPRSNNLDTSVNLSGGGSPASSPSPTTPPTSPPSPPISFGGEAGAPSCVVPKRLGGTRQQIEEIYQAYPRKVGKGYAIKAIDNALVSLKKRAVTSPAGEEWTGWLLGRVAAYAAATDRRTVADPSSRNFIPHPATWFNGAHYDDDPAEWEPHGNRKELKHANGYNTKCGSTGDTRSHIPNTRSIPRFGMQSAAGAVGVGGGSGAGNSSSGQDGSRERQAT